MIIDTYIFINAHLSSKDELNRKQIKDLKDGITALKQKLPDYGIVIAGDLNSYLEPFSKNFSYYPIYAEDTTTIKKRTFTQGQYHKAEKVVKESKDKIVSTLDVIDGKISYITGD
jgi:endonuclease/exonuclease/phosphatase family metal-dependent hydrolase